MISHVLVSNSATTILFAFAFVVTADVCTDVACTHRRRRRRQRRYSLNQISCRGGD